MKPNQRLKRERELRGWSQAKVASEVGTDPATVSRWERGLSFPFECLINCIDFKGGSFFNFRGVAARLGLLLAFLALRILAMIAPPISRQAAAATNRCIGLS